jgi:hypothetical protein
MTDYETQARKICERLLLYVADSDVKYVANALKRAASDERKKIETSMGWIGLTASEVAAYNWPNDANMRQAFIFGAQYNHVKGGANALDIPRRLSTYKEGQHTGIAKPVGQGS